MLNIKRMAGPILLAACTACSTPQPVTDLTKSAATNVSLLQSELNGFVKPQADFAVARAENLSRLSEVAEEMQAEFDVFYESSRAASVVAGEEKGPTFSKLLEELRRVSETITQRQREVQEKRDQARADALASQESVDLPKSQLKTISTQLGSLLKSSDQDANVAFFRAFLSEALTVVKEIRQKAEEDAAAGANADPNAGAL